MNALVIVEFDEISLIVTKDYNIDWSNGTVIDNRDLEEKKFYSNQIVNIFDPISCTYRAIKVSEVNCSDDIIIDGIVYVVINKC